MATVTKKPWTADELCRLPKGWRYEIDDGELVIMSPAGSRHAQIVANVTSVLVDFVRPRKLGSVLSGEPGVYLRREPRQTLRGVDVAFFAVEGAQRIRGQRGFAEVAPDLAVEVDDPSEPDLRGKVAEYLAAGVRAVWIVDPESESLTRHAPGEAPHTWSSPDGVVEEPVMPGFSCRLRDLFE